MKKKLIFVMMVVLSIGIAMAQNANRHGFFLELGAGGLLGNTPRTSIFITDNVVKYKCLSGAVVDFGFGGRIRIKNNWAYEIKGEANIPMSNPQYSFVGRFLPVGFRYTSTEILRNYSLYAHANLGAAIILNRGIYRDWSYPTYYPTTEEFKLKNVGNSEGLGIAYSLGIGANITTHLYVECCFLGQSIFNGFGKNGKSMLIYGTLGCIIGYRF